MSSRLKIHAIIRNLLISIILSFLVISLLTCGEDEPINAEKVKTAPAKLEIMMSPKVSIAEITSVKLIVTGDNMDPIETELLIDRNLGKATGSVNVPIGDNRVFQVEVYAGGFLRYFGQQQIDVRSATSVRIPVGIKPAEGIGVIAISEHIKSNGLAIAIGDADIFLLKSDGNQRFVQNLAKFMGNAPRLKIDLSRGTAFSSPILQELEATLRNAGFQIQEDESFTYDRSKYDVILFALPNRSFDLSQINAIQQFVRSGGMLLLLADSGENLEPINNLGNAFGLNFEYSVVNIAGGDPSSIILRNLATLPLFDGVFAINSSFARSIGIKPDPSGELRLYNGATPGAGAIVSADEPKLFISPTQADLGEILQTVSFDIGNVGTGTLSWNIVKDPPLPNWLSISPESGKASAGEKRNVIAKVNRSGLDPGEYRHTIQVNSNAGQGKILIIMRVPEPDPVLSFTPSSLNFGTTDTQKTLTITNNGGKTLDWQTSKGQTWLSISPSSGSLSSGQSQTITVTVNRAGLASGNYSDTISITSNGGSGSISVSMSVPEPSPSLSISPTSIDFGTINTQMTFNITNSGGGTLNWQASKQQLWLTILPTTGSLTAGKSQTVTLTINRGDLKAGTYRDVVSITTNVGSGNVNVTMTVPEPSPSLAFSPTSIDFGTTETTKTLTITNKGGGTLNWQATKTQAWLTISPTSGTLTSGNSQNVTLTVNRANLNPGSYKDTISITSNGGNGSVAITMTVPEPSPSLAFSPTSID
ncbi:MAG: BACON domain-containing protein, partial [Candidatus Poribacteria bacterium]